MTVWSLNRAAGGSALLERSDKGINVVRTYRNPISKRGGELERIGYTLRQESTHGRYLCGGERDNVTGDESVLSGENL